MTDQEARFYRPIDNNAVVCTLCPHGCRLGEEETGICHVRTNRGGKLWSDNYGHLSALALDPIEKKPLHHFHPGSMILSAGSYGCNLRCSFCQNHEIAQSGVPQGNVPLMQPAELADQTVRMRHQGNIGLAFTYNEPIVWYEYMLETAQLVRSAGLKTVLVTNGMINPEPLRQLLPFIDAMNIDLKAFNPDFYQTVVRGSLSAVRRTIERSQAACHVEITTLIIPGLNDSEQEMEEMASWLASMRADIPLHLSRYFPRYQMNDRPPTSKATLEQLAAIAHSRLRHVHLGNI